MGCLYIGTSYGYVFQPKGEDKDRYNEWLESKDSYEFVKKCKENADNNEQPNLNLIDDDNGLKFYFSVKGEHLGCIFGYSTFQMGDLSVEEEVSKSLHEAYKAMLLDTNVPEFFRINSNWRVAGTLFHVTT